ncbi:MAG: branched-chain amino acid ABC transporter permease [Chitinivibrionales bacterium]|nr:branched-chain amino acid ABC transporter permease [Chitinivibrionales bacterium]
MPGRHLLPIVALAVVMIVLQLICTVAGVSYYLTQLTMVAYYGLVIVGLCLLMGYAGQISLGHAGFFAIGGYTAAVITTRNLVEWDGNALIGLLRRLGLVLHMVDPYGREILHLSPWLSLAAAVLITVVLAFLIGMPVLKLRGHYLAMATLGFGMIIYRVLLGGRVFGEADGISDVPAFALVPGVVVDGGRDVRVLNFYLAWAALLGALALAANLIRSRVGRALSSIHGNEEAANAMGVNTAHLKLRVFVLSAVFAAVGGVLLTHFNGGIGPSEAGVMKSVRYVAIVAVGGMSNLWGVVAWGVGLNFLSLRGYFGSYDDAVFGSILVLVMLFAPEGVSRSPHVRSAAQFIRRKFTRGAA